MKPGDVVKVDQSLVTLESDKATMDVPSPVAGAVAEVVAKVGDKVSMGDADRAHRCRGGRSRRPGGARQGFRAACAAPSAPAKAAAAPAPAKAGTIDVAIPDIGDFKDVPIIEILVKEGETVAADQPLVTLESDKATMDVPSPAAGKIAQIVAKVGDKVSMGALIAKLDAAGDAACFVEQARPAEANADAAPQAPPAAAARRRRSAPPAERRPVRQRRISPASSPGRRFAGLRASSASISIASRAQARRGASPARTSRRRSLARRAGGRAGGGGALPAIPAVDFAKFGPVETVPLSRIKRISGPRLHASWVNVPHVTHCDEADITDLDAFRKTLDEDAKKDKSKPYRVSLLPLLMRATVATLKAFPTFNAALSPAGDALIMRRYWEIGVAVDTPDGLVVAVVKDVDQKGVIELARELGALSEKARAGKLAPAEMQGATFTISSLGGIGGTAFSPIVNAPEVAILGVVRSKMAPVWDGAAFQPRLMLPLCLSYDHRVIDGAAAARFMRHLAGVVEDMRRVIL